MDGHARHDSRVDGDLRLCEILGSLSLAPDLGNGFASEHALRTAVLAVELSRGVGDEPPATKAALYTALLKQIGCTALDYEMGHRYGDPAAARRVFSHVDFGQPSHAMPHVLRNLGRGEGMATRGRILALFLTQGKQEGSTPGSSTVASPHASRSGSAPLRGSARRWDKSSTGGTARV